VRCKAIVDLGNAHRVCLLTAYIYEGFVTALLCQTPCSANCGHRLVLARLYVLHGRASALVADTASDANVHARHQTLLQRKAVMYTLPVDDDCQD
jgi:hypothetical protein